MILTKLFALATVLMAVNTGSLEVAPIKVGYACEGMKMTLECESNQSISVTSATYGYNDSGKCHNEVKKEPCLVDMKTEVARRCNELSKCVLAVIFTEHTCPQDTYKEAIVQYQCLEKETLTRFARIGGMMKLGCPKDKRLQIIHGMYEPPIDEKCCDNQQMKTFRCLSSGVLKRCNGQRGCTFKANKKSFQNLCPTSPWKLAMIKYYCI